VNTTASLIDTSFTSFLVTVLIAAALATLIFRHAHRKGNRHASAWGVFTFLAVLIATPFYFLKYWWADADDDDAEVLPARRALRGRG
jgi:hypothetical protein